MSATDIRTDYSMTAGEALPIAVRAAGCRIETEDGTSYLDACGGAMVMLLGHGHPRVVEALKRQSEVLNFTYRFSFRNEPMLELAERVRAGRAGRPRVVLLQLVRLRGQRVGDAPGRALLGAVRASRRSWTSCPG